MDKTLRCDLKAQGVEAMSATTKIFCPQCHKVTEHVELTQRTFAKFHRRNGGQQEIEIKALIMCLACHGKREPVNPSPGA